MVCLYVLVEEETLTQYVVKGRDGGQCRGLKFKRLA